MALRVRLAGAPAVNAIPMLVRCAIHQQGDGLYVFTDGTVGRGFEMTDTPVVAAPSDRGVADHAEFHLPGEGPQMATVTVDG